jgi:hypothetical protein
MQVPAVPKPVSIEILDDPKIILNRDFNWNCIDMPSETGSKYGFNNLYHGYSKSLYQIAFDIIDIADIDSATRESIRQERIAAETANFDREHYLYPPII